MQGRQKMNIDTSKRVIRFLIIMLILSGCNEARDIGQKASLDRMADEAAIRALLTANFVASTARNATGVAETFMADGDAWIAGLSRVSTHDAIRSLEEDFGGMPGFRSYDARIENIRFISRDAAIIEILGTTTLDTGSFDEETTIVATRTIDGWRIAAWRVMTFDETLLNMLRG
jgi:uncharacterized protein (TIGR02246 family)